MLRENPEYSEIVFVQARLVDDFDDLLFVRLLLEDLDGAEGYLWAVETLFELRKRLFVENFGVVVFSFQIGFLFRELELNPPQLHQGEHEIHAQRLFEVL